jgi:hypothetical protein
MHDASWARHKMLQLRRFNHLGGRKLLLFGMLA